MRILALAIWCLLLAQICLAQVRDPSEASTKAASSKYRSKDPKSVEEVLFGIDTTKHGAHECHYSVDIIYQNELLSDENTLVSPTISDLHATGERDLVFAKLNSAHLINGRTGELQRGQWPVLLGDTDIYSQPLLYDINEDGIEEIIITTDNGEIVFIDLYGNPLIGKTFKIPKLRVRKDWYTGLDTDDVDAFYSLKEHEDSDAEDENSNKVNKNSKTYEDLEDEGLNDWLEQQRQEMLDLINTLKDELTEEGIRSLDLLLSSREIKHNDQDELFYSIQYENYLKENPAAVKVDAKYLQVDAHVMASPIIADLNRNGQYYLIVPVSYYFDDSASKSPLRRNEFIGVYPNRYIASGVVAFNLKTKTIAWTTHLDLTTDNTEYRGYMLASPVTADLNGDGRLEVLVTTAVGFVYVLEADGTWNKQFSPESMSSIYASPLVDDFNNDGNLDVLVVDDKGNVVLFNDKGREIWENTIAGTTLYNPVSGDINGDGILDIVVLTEEGIVWALQGNNGQIMKNFPVKLGGESTQPILLPIKGNNTLDIIFFTDDGHLYIIDGGSGCFETIDFGEEESMGFVLADDIRGNGKMNLLLTTRNSFALLETQMDYDPIWAWKTLSHSSGPITGNRFGVRISKELKAIKNIVGRDFSFYFDIVDNRRHIKPPNYTVRIFNGAAMLGEYKYTVSGQQKVKMTSPNIHHETLIRIEVMNEFGQVAFDEFAVSFNAHFDRDFAWILAMPFIGMCFVLLFVKEMKSVLPV